MALQDARSLLELSNVPPAERTPAGKGPQGETLGTRINGTAVPRPDESQVIGRSSVDARFVIAVDIDSREHARIRVDGGEQTIADLGRFTDMPLDREKLVNGLSGLIEGGARIGWGRRQLDTHFPNGRD